MPPSGRADEADCETARIERGPNAAKRAGQHHAVELDINDAGLFRDELAEGGKYQRRGEGDRGREEEDRCGDIHGHLLVADLQRGSRLLAPRDAFGQAKRGKKIADGEAFDHRRDCR